MSMPTPAGAAGFLDAAALVEAMQRFADAVATRRELLDRLNVFPVPDGDTGSNLASTARSVCDALAAGAAGATADMATVCGAIGRGSLLGARGNSGVILSQILSEMARTLAAAPVADGRVLAEALGGAARAAYTAVGRPVEGTILTVMREAAQAAAAASAAGGDLAAVARQARVAASAAVARTPELLPVLADAGVVDAGGAGLALLFDAVASVVDGQPLLVADTADAVAAWGLAPSVAAWPAGQPGTSPRTGPDQGPGPGGPGAGLSSRFEVMFVLDAPAATGADLDALRTAWDGIGDSVVVVGGDGLWSCHVHTDDIGAAIEAGSALGRLRDVRVTDLAEQVALRTTGPCAPPAATVAAPGTAAATAVVAVANGAELTGIVAGQGAAVVVRGGQGANPSTAELAAAVRSAGAPTVVVLPNNANVVAVAERLADVLGSPGDPQVVVVPTRSVVAGLAALSVCNPLVPATDNAAPMAAAAASVVAAEVTVAVRDSQAAVGAITAGDWLGVHDGEVVVAGSDPVAVVTGLLGGLLAAGVGGDAEVVTVFTGEGSSAGVTAAVTQWLADVHPDVDVEVHHGGQPLYPYLIGIE